MRMPLEEEDLSDEYDLIQEHLSSPERPPERVIACRVVLGHEMSPERVKHELTPVLESDLLVPTRERFVAYGGDLPFDVVFVVGFDGVQSRVLSVRYLVRPDREDPIRASRLRQIPLEGLVQAAITERRSVFREVAPGDLRLRAVSDEERRKVYESAVGSGQYAARWRISDEDLKRTAEVYRFAVANGQPPTAAVERELSLRNRNTAKKWVQGARRVGLLPPPPKERQGGIRS